MSNQQSDVPTWWFTQDINTKEWTVYLSWKKYGRDDSREFNLEQLKTEITRRKDAGIDVPQYYEKILDAFERKRYTESSDEV